MNHCSLPNDVLESGSNCLFQDLSLNPEISEQEANHTVSRMTMNSKWMATYTLKSTLNSVVVSMLSAWVMVIP
jgi:hypothetical protein